MQQWDEILLQILLIYNNFSFSHDILFHIN